MDFRRSTAPPWMNPREQRRLLLLVLLLGLVLWMMTQVRHPQMWRWMEGGEGIPPAGGAAAPGGTGAEGTRDDVPKDNRAAPFEDATTREGVFRSPAAVPVDQRPAVDPGNWEIEAELLRPIRDNAPFRTTEHSAWFAMWERLQQAEPQAVAAAGDARVSYAQLDRQPEAWRGRLVTLRGVFHRAMPARAPANQRGIGRYYEVWLEPTEAPALPVVVHCLELPAGFPQGMQIRAEGTVSGYFFKRWLYDSPDGLRTAPLVIARTVTGSPGDRVGRRLGAREGTLLVLLGMGLGLGAAGWLFFRVAPRRSAMVRNRGPVHVELPVSEGG